MGGARVGEGDPVDVSGVISTYNLAPMLGVTQVLLGGLSWI